jgi:hypothetical protein
MIRPSLWPTWLVVQLARAMLRLANRVFGR